MKSAALIAAIAAGTAAQAQERYDAGTMSLFGDITSYANTCVGYARSGDVLNADHGIVTAEVAIDGDRLSIAAEIRPASNGPILTVALNRDWAASPYLRLSCRATFPLTPAAMEEVWPRLQEWQDTAPTRDEWVSGDWQDDQITLRWCLDAAGTTGANILRADVQYSRDAANDLVIEVTAAADLFLTCEAELP